MTSPEGPDLSTYDWLVVNQADSNAQFKGFVGTEYPPGKHKLEGTGQADDIGEQVAQAVVRDQATVDKDRPELGSL